MGRSPSFKGLRPASRKTTAAARGASRKADTTPELALRRALWRLGLRYRKTANDLPGRPDVVFRSVRLAVFCDGDFWHGKDWPARKAKLTRGHNAEYWIAKIERNIARDVDVDQRLAALGWRSLRFWESAIRADPDGIANQVRDAINSP